MTDTKLQGATRLTWYFGKATRSTRSPWRILTIILILYISVDRIQVGTFR